VNASVPVPSTKNGQGSTPVMHIICKQRSPVA
jgi:hypothetical protein